MKTIKKFSRVAVAAVVMTGAIAVTSTPAYCMFGGGSILAGQRVVANTGLNLGTVGGVIVITLAAFISL